VTVGVGVGVGVADGVADAVDDAGLLGEGDGVFAAELGGSVGTVPATNAIVGVGALVGRAGDRFRGADGAVPRTDDEDVDEVGSDELGAGSGASRMIWMIAPPAGSGSVGQR
jgi:hypothetical protein